MLQGALSQVADAVADVLAVQRDRLGADELIMRAQRRTGLGDFGDAPFEKPLRIFLRACREEGDLGFFGGLATRWDTVRFLSNLLRLRREEKRTPGITDQPIERPISSLSMWRLNGRLSTSVSRATDARTASGSRWTKTMHASG